MCSVFRSFSVSIETLCAPNNPPTINHTHIGLILVFVGLYFGNKKPTPVVAVTSAQELGTTGADQSLLDDLNASLLPYDENDLPQQQANPMFQRARADTHTPGIGSASTGHITGLTAQRNDSQESSSSEDGKKRLLGDRAT